MDWKFFLHLGDFDTHYKFKNSFQHLHQKDGFIRWVKIEILIQSPFFSANANGFIFHKIKRFLD